MVQNTGGGGIFIFKMFGRFIDLLLLKLAKLVTAIKSLTTG